MRFYETTIVLSPTSDESAVGHEIEKITQTISGASGRIVTTQRWGVKRTAYPLLKHTQAVYVHFVYQAPPAVPGKLEAMFRINENILRHLTVLVEGPLTSKRFAETSTAEAMQPGPLALNEAETADVAPLDTGSRPGEVGDGTELQGI